MRAWRPVRNQSRYFGLTICAACLALGLSGFAGRERVRAAGEGSLSARIDAEFSGVKATSAEVQQQAPRLDQALEAFAANLEARADLSADEKAAALARVEQARTVLRTHGETLKRAATGLGGAAAAAAADARREIDALAQLLTVEGDHLVSVVADQAARKTGDSDQLAAAHAAYRKAVKALVDAARKMQDDGKNKIETSTGKAENR
jgi:hypothetical protein